MVERLTVAEAAGMSCAELAAESARAEAVRAEIDETEAIDWSSVLGLVGNMWPGNDRERADAHAALDARLADIETARAQKGCAAPDAESSG